MLCCFFVSDSRDLATLYKSNTECTSVSLNSRNMYLYWDYNFLTSRWELLLASWLASNYNFPHFVYVLVNIKSNNHLCLIMPVGKLLAYLWSKCPPTGSMLPSLQRPVLLKTVSVYELLRHLHSEESMLKAVHVK